MKKEQSGPFDYEQAKQKVKEQLRSGKSLFGKEGAFAPLLQEMLNSILEGEMDAHLDEGERSAVVGVVHGNVRWHHQQQYFK
jgi:putative transposase